MEPFSIICETCRAKLKVRDSNIVSQIHACPKCGSMVQIVAPAAQLIGPELATTPAAPEPAPHVATSLPMEFGDVAESAMPVAATTSPIVVWGFSGTALLLLGLAVGMWAAGRDTGDASPPIAGIDEESSDVASLAANDPYAVGNKGNKAPPQSEVELPEVDDNTSTLGGSSLSPLLPDLPSIDDDLTSKVREPAPQTMGEALTYEGPKQLGERAASTTAPRGSSVLNFDPMDFDPTRLSLGATESNPWQSAGSITEDEAKIEAEVSSERDNSDGPIERQPVEPPKLHVQRGPIIPTASNVKITEFNLRIELLEVHDMPLGRFLDLLADMTSVPITLDPAALELAGISATTAITAVFQKTTDVAGLLRNVLNEKRLNYIPGEQNLQIVLKDYDRLRTVSYDVKDLADGSSAESVVELITKLVAPKTWQANGGQGVILSEGTKLQINQLQAVHHEILIFCERLRQARGLPLRSRYPSDRLRLEPPDIATSLGRSATFTFLPWTRLREVVNYWQNTSGVTILVDWAALAREELVPTSLISCSAIEQRWEDVFDNVLEPLGLTWWIVDDSTIQITSRDALNRMERVEFYAVPASLLARFISSDALIESLDSELQQDGSVATTTFAIDQVSHRLIVRTTPSSHRYLMQRLNFQAE